MSLSDLLNAGLLHPGQELSFKRGSDVHAHVTADGTIAMGDKHYKSPSTASRAAANGMASNGWRQWFVNEGDVWTDLATLRARLTERTSPVVH